MVGSRTAKKEERVNLQAAEMDGPGRDRERGAAMPNMCLFCTIILTQQKERERDGEGEREHDEREIKIEGDRNIEKIHREKKMG